MANRITIEPTKFVNVRTDNVSFGWRAYDDYSQCYDNTLERIPEDDLEFLSLVVEHNCDVILGGMLDFVTNNEQGINIGDNHYTHDQIKEILNA
jgi:hypothetical protein